MAQEWAEKMFESRSHDFGTVPRGGEVRYSFKFQNTYVEDVHVVSVRSSCGCAEPRLTKDTLKTFEEAEIVANFNTRAFLGQRSATLTVTFDKPFYAQVLLNVSGYIRSDVVLNPGSVQFGEVSQGEPARQKLNINYAGNNSWKIVDIRSANPFLKAVAKQKRRENGQVSYDVLVELSEDADPGYFKDQLTVITNLGRARTVPIAVQGRVLGHIEATPNSLYLGRLHPGESVTKRLVVRGKEPFRITDVECDSCFEVKTSSEARIKHLVPVSFTADKTLGKVSHEIKIHTDLGEQYFSTFEAVARVVAADQSS